MLSTIKMLSYLATLCRIDSSGTVYLVMLCMFSSYLHNLWKLWTHVCFYIWPFNIACKLCIITMRDTPWWTVLADFFLYLEVKYSFESKALNVHSWSSQGTEPINCQVISTPVKWYMFWVFNFGLIFWFWIFIQLKTCEVTFDFETM